MPKPQPKQPQRQAPSVNHASPPASPADGAASGKPASSIRRSRKERQLQETWQQRKQYGIYTLVALIM